MQPLLMHPGVHFAGLLPIADRAADTAPACFVY
jgi:hypothetical protein